MSSGLSIEELEHLCGKLQRRVGKYETKLSDLVNAYKQLADDKHVLEDTVKALSSKSEQKKDESQFKSFLQKSKELVTKSKPATAVADDTENNDAATKETSDDKTKEALEERFSTLTAAYQSLLDSKTKMDKVYQEDKKSMLNEHNHLVASLKEEKSKLTSKVDELRGKLLQEQQERSTDQNHHASIMKELQNVITEERLQKDELQMQLHESKTTVTTLSSKAESPPQNKVVLEKSISVEDAERELEKMKKDLVGEQKKVKEAEEFFRVRMQQQEDRIYQLENKVSELSTTIGEYEVQKNEDQLLIRKLRHKLDNLDAEKSALLISVNDVKKDAEKEKAFEPPRISKRHSSYNSQLDDFVVNGNETSAYYNITDEAHHKCNLDYKILKSELESLKQKYARLQQEHEQQKSKLSVLRVEKDRIADGYKEKEKGFLELMSKLQLENTKLYDKHDVELESLRTANTKQINSLQSELQKLRNRSMNLISEKDSEIEKLQKVMYDQDGLFSNESRRILVEGPKKIDHVSSSNTKNQPDNIINEILSSPTKSTDGSLFHFIEQTNYEKELSLLREKTLDAQGQNRDYEQREEKILQQMQVLKDEIRRLERNRSRESANLEYLKNICFRYMMTSSSSVKRQMSTAISSILQFSSSEIQELEKRQQAGWW